MNIFVGAPGREFLGSSEVFIILFVTFGPINFINRLSQMAAETRHKGTRRVAVRNVLTPRPPSFCRDGSVVSCSGHGGFRSRRSP